MPDFDVRSGDRIVDQGDGEIYAAVKLTAPEAVAAYGVGKLAGFYKFAEADIEDARKLKRDLGSKLITTENGVIRKQVRTKDEAMMDMVLLYDDNATKALLEILRRKAHTYRLVAPGAVADGVDADGQTFHEVTALRNAFCSDGFEKEYKPGVRKQAVTITGSRTADGKPSVTQVAVDLADEETWPDELVDVKSDAV